MTERQRLERLAQLFDAAQKGLIPLPLCFDCPKCKAAPGEHCNRATLGRYLFHRDRVESALGYSDDSE